MTALLFIAAVTVAVALGVAPTVALLLALCAPIVAACAWIWVTVVSARYERVLKARYEPLPPSQKLGHRHGRPQLDPLAVHYDQYWTTAREASALAEAPPTLPMPVVDLAEWGAHEYGGAR